MNRTWTRVFDWILVTVGIVAAMLVFGTFIYGVFMLAGIKP